MEASRAPQNTRHRASLRQLTRFARPTDRAFEQLYRRHARQVYQYALAVLSNPADAEDVTQTTFLNAYRAFQKGERPEKPHNWLIAIAHNVCRMRWRQAGSRPREVALEEAPEPVSYDHERPDLDEVLTALAQLSFNQRAALVMRELEGRSYQEIAEILDTSVSAVEALLFRARRRLQVKRKAIGVLTTVPLPGSLTAFIGGGGGVVAAGGAVLGSDLVLKTAAVVAAGVATAGVGYKAVDAVTATDAAPHVTAKPVAPARAHRKADVPRAARRSQHPTVTRHHPSRAVSPARGSRVSRPAPASQAPVTQPPAAVPAAPAPATAPAPPAIPPPPPPVTAPALPQLPVKPPPPPALPPLPPLLPPLPPPPVTVTVPPLPPTPPLP
jgi:RNA polymerase sigma factor (sigma-70 family)